MGLTGLKELRQINIRWTAKVGQKETLQQPDMKIYLYIDIYISIMNLLRKKGGAWVDYPIYNSFKKYLGWGAWKDGSTDKGVWYAIPGTHLKVEREHQLHQCLLSPTLGHAW